MGSDGEPCFGAGFGSVAPGDLDLRFRRSDVAFGLVIRERHVEVLAEEQDAVLVSVEAFQ